MEMLSLFIGNRGVVRLEGLWEEMVCGGRRRISGSTEGSPGGKGENLQLRAWTAVFKEDLEPSSLDVRILDRPLPSQIPVDRTPAGLMQEQHYSAPRKA